MIDKKSDPIKRYSAMTQESKGFKLVEAFE
jgi:hypothetical protein